MEDTHLCNTLRINKEVQNKTTRLIKTGLCRFNRKVLLYKGLYQTQVDRKILMEIYTVMSTVMLYTSQCMIDKLFVVNCRFSHTVCLALRKGIQILSFIKIIIIIIK